MVRIAYLASLVFIATIPCESAVVIAGARTIAMVIGVATAAVWLCSIPIPSEPRKPRLLHAALFAFLLWNIASFYWTLAPDRTLVRIGTYVQLGVAAWMLWDLYRTTEQLRAALQAYVLGGFVSIAATLANYNSGVEIKEYAEGRFSGLGLNANDLALILALGLPLAWHLTTTPSSSRGGRIARWVNLAYIPLAIFAIALTASRTAIFAVAPALIYMLWTLGRFRPRVRVAVPVLLCVSAFAIWPYMPQATVERLGSTFASVASGDLGGREQLWIRSFEVFGANPVLGVGSGAAGATAVGAFVHNSFLSVMVELGCIGAVLWFTISAIVLVKAWRQPQPQRGVCLSLLCVWIIGASTLTWEFTKPTWLVFTFIALSSTFSDEHDGAEDTL